MSVVRNPVLTKIWLPQPSSIFGWPDQNHGPPDQNFGQPNQIAVWTAYKISMSEQDPPIQPLEHLRWHFKKNFSNHTTYRYTTKMCILLTIMNTFYILHWGGWDLTHFTNIKICFIFSYSLRSQVVPIFSAFYLKYLLSKWAANFTYFT